jgi:hypothetical protein
MTERMSMPIHNAEIAEIYSELTDLLEIEEANPFRVLFQQIEPAGIDDSTDFARQI